MRFLLVGIFDLPQESEEPTGYNPKAYYEGLTLKQRKEVATYDFSADELIEWLEEPSNDKDEYFFFKYNTTK